MNDVQELLKKQAEWQRKLRSLTWAEKIRMAEAIRESVLRLGPSAPKDQEKNRIPTVPGSA